MPRGRWRCPRWINAMPPAPMFRPMGMPTVNVVTLRVEELEAIRLVDLEGLEQEEAAKRMGVSRKTLWTDLKSARKKVAYALVNGYAIEIRGGSYLMARR